jgi:hypothetical protein
VVIITVRIKGSVIILTHQFLTQHKPEAFTTTESDQILSDQYYSVNENTGEINAQNAEAGADLY